MKAKLSEPTTIDQYIALFPPEVRAKLEKVRQTIRNAAPAATEAIKYRMPTFVFNGNLVHFAGYQHHIGFYPAPSGIEAFKKELSAYKSAKGSVQFPLDQPVPHLLIARITRFRVKENRPTATAGRRHNSNPGARSDRRG